MCRSEINFQGFQAAKSSRMSRHHHREAPDFSKFDTISNQNVSFSKLVFRPTTGFVSLYFASLLQKNLGKTYLNFSLNSIIFFLL